MTDAIAAESKAVRDEEAFDVTALAPRLHSHADAQAVDLIGELSARKFPGGGPAVSYAESRCRRPIGVNR